MIGERPPEIEHRERIGDYEMDTVIGTPSGEVLVTMVERRSRFTFFLKAFDKSSLEVGAAIVTALHPHRESVHTLTYDNGKEFARHALIDEILGSKGYFAQPYHSWERGLNENTNGLIRQYFPKQTDFGKITDEQVREVQDKLNDRPRKCLGWRTPGGILRPSRHRCTSGLKPPFEGVVILPSQLHGPPHAFPVEDPCPRIEMAVGVCLPFRLPHRERAHWDHSRRSGRCRSASCPRCDSSASPQATIRPVSSASNHSQDQGGETVVPGISS